MSPTRIALLLSFLSATALPRAQSPFPAAAPPPATPADSSPIPTIRVTSRLVVLDVTVTNGYGKVISGLKPSDFTILEDGVPQKIASFTEHTLGTPIAAAPSTLPPNTFAVQPPIPEDRTRTVLVLAANTPFVRYEIRQFMKTVPPGAPIAIVKIDTLGTHLVQSFTTDPKILQEAAASQRILPPLGFVLPSQVKRPNVRGLARYLATVPGRINVVWFGGGDVPIAQMETEFSDLSSFVRNVDGATNVLHLSRVAVFPVAAGGVIVPATDRADFDLDAMFTNPLTAPIVTAPGELDSIALQGTGLFSQRLTPLQSDLQDAARFFAEGNLDDLAAATGGKNFYNTNDFKGVMQEVVDSGADYYTISYTPNNSNWNGQIRRIRIDVPQDLLLSHESTWERLQYAVEKPASLRYRNFYYARTRPVAAPDTSFAANPASQRILISSSPKGDPNPAGLTAALQQATGFGAAAPDQVYFTIAVTPSAGTEKPKTDAASAHDNFLAAPFADAPCRSYRVHYWIDPKDLQFARPAGGAYRDDLRFIAVVYADDGTIANSVSTAAHIQFPASALEAISAEGVTFDQTIAIPVRKDANAPNFYLRVAVSETSTRHIGALEIPVESIQLPPAQTLAAQKGAP